MAIIQRLFEHLLTRGERSQESDLRQLQIDRLRQLLGQEKKEAETMGEFVPTYEPRPAEMLPLELTPQEKEIQEAPYTPPPGVSVETKPGYRGMTYRDVTALNKIGLTPLPPTKERPEGDVIRSALVKSMELPASHYETIKDETGNIIRTDVYQAGILARRYDARGKEIPVGEGVTPKTLPDTESEILWEIPGMPQGAKGKIGFIREKKTGKLQQFKIDGGGKLEGIEESKLASSLRKEFEDLRPVKDYRDTTAKYDIMREAYKESLETKNFVAVDQALITLFNKMTDPQSVVRESEYVRTPSDLALWNRLKGKVERLMAGGPGLTPEDRKALMTMAGKFRGAYAKKFNAEVGRFSEEARRANIDPTRIVPPMDVMAPEKLPEIVSPVVTPKQPTSGTTSTGGKWRVRPRTK